MADWSLNGVDRTQLPNFTTNNGKGNLCKWWFSPTITDWAQRENLHGTSLPTVRGWVVEDTDGDSYVLTEGQSIIYSTQRFEDACVHIDMMKLDKELC